MHGEIEVMARDSGKSPAFAILKVAVHHAR